MSQFISMVATHPSLFPDVYQLSPLCRSEFCYLIRDEDLMCRISPDTHGNLPTWIFVICMALVVSNPFFLSIRHSQHWALMLKNLINIPHFEQTPQFMQLCSYFNNCNSSLGLSTFSHLSIVFRFFSQDVVTISLRVHVGDDQKSVGCGPSLCLDRNSDIQFFFFFSQDIRSAQQLHSEAKPPPPW